MQYQQISPPDFLKNFVRYFWTLESSGSNRSVPEVMGPLADGCPGLLFQPNEEGVFFDEWDKQLPQVFIYGQTVKRTSLYMYGRFKTLGVCFEPFGLGAIYRAEVSELTDECLDLKLVSHSFTEQLLNTGSFSAQIEVLSSYLFELIKKSRYNPDHVALIASSKIIQTSGMISLKELQKSLNLSERSLERRFKQHIGISPKVFANVCRFQSVLSQLKKNDFSKLSDIAYDNGYADQSHFIRSFKEFTGCTPHLFHKKNLQLAESHQ